MIKLTIQQWRYALKFSKKQPSFSAFRWNSFFSKGRTFRETSGPRNEYDLKADSSKKNRKSSSFYLNEIMSFETSLIAYSVVSRNKEKFVCKRNEKKPQNMEKMLNWMLLSLFLRRIVLSKTDRTENLVWVANFAVNIKTERRTRKCSKSAMHSRLFLSKSS